MIRKSLLLMLAFSFLLIIGCSDDEAPQPRGAYDNGVLVINEGNFLEGDASVSFLGGADNKVELNVFEGVNNRALGDVAQSAYPVDTTLFLIVNNSNKVEVVGRYSMKSLFTVEAQLPRYMTVSDGKGYLTEWVSFSERGRLTIINPTSGAVEARVSVGFGAEDVEVLGNKAYVSNSFENTVSVVSLSTREVTTITMPSAAPAQMEVDANGDLWVACRGGFDSNFDPSNDGVLVKIDTETDQIESVYALNVNFSGKLAKNSAANTIYYFVGNEVFSQDISAMNRSASPFISNTSFTSIYGIGVNPATGEVMLADSKFFLEDGQVFKYSGSGDLLDTYEVGRGPNGFVFN